MSERYMPIHAIFDGLGHHYNWHAREKDREIVCYWPDDFFPRSPVLWLEKPPAQLSVGAQRDRAGKA